MPISRWRSGSRFWSSAWSLPSMKKKKALREINKPREAKPSAAVPRPRRRWGPPWWTWVSALAGLFVVFEVYAPALNGGFVFDDLFLPFHDLNMGPRLAE